MAELFERHELNAQGRLRSNQIKHKFTILLEGLEELCGTGGREMAIVRTKLQEASFFATRAMALRQENQE